MGKCNLMEKINVIGLTSPVDTTSTTVNSDVINMGKYPRVDFLVYLGTITGDTAVITLEECDDVTPSNSAAIAFNYRESAATGTSDLWGSITAATSSGVTASAADDDHIFCISVDASELADGYPYARIVVDPGGSASACEVAILALADGRNKQNIPITALT